MPIAKMMGRMGKMAGKGATAIMKDRAAPAKASGLGRLMDVVKTAKSEQDERPKAGPMMGDKPAGRGRFGRMIGAAVNAAPKAMKKGGMAEKMKMVVKDGKKVPSFAADGVGKMKKGGSVGMHRMPDGTMMKNSDMAGRAMKKTTADAKGRAMKKGK